MADTSALQYRYDSIIDFPYQKTNTVSGTGDCDMAKELPSVDTIRDALNYDPNTGALTWRRSGFRRDIGATAGVSRVGYRWITFAGQDLMGGRIAWVMAHGEWPQTRVRFRDGDGTNLRLDNLYVDAFKWQTKERKNEKNRTFRIAQPDMVKNQDLKRTFGITLQRYTEILTEQKGVCAICQQPETAIRLGKLKMLCVDHNHTTEAVRGLLCHECNIGIGKLQDRADLCRAAADYLDRHAQPTPLKRTA